MNNIVQFETKTLSILQKEDIESDLNFWTKNNKVFKSVW